jgi:hypothetical protein
LLLTMQPSCLRLSLVTTAGFMFMNLRQSNNRYNGSAQTHQYWKDETNDMKGIVHKELILVGQPFDSAYSCDIVQWPHENVGGLCPELWWQINWLLHHDKAPFFNREFLTKNNTVIIPHPSYLPDLAPYDYFLFPWLKTGHFDTIVVTEAELQIVLNTVTEHDFQDAF